MRNFIHASYSWALSQAYKNYQKCRVQRVLSTYNSKTGQLAIWGLLLEA